MSVIAACDIELTKEYLRMAKAAREMEEPAGVNVDQSPERLVSNAATELTTYYYYTILRASLIGLEGEGIKEIAEVALMVGSGEKERETIRPEFDRSIMIH
jgi:ferritin-like protein